MTNGICDICTRWYCTIRHELEGTPEERNRAKVAKWQRENRDKVNAKQTRYYERLRAKRSLAQNDSAR